MRAQLHERIRRTARAIAESAGATAEVEIDDGNPITWNDPDLARRVRPTLERVAGRERVIEPLPWTGAEDFSRYQERVPGVFFFLGINPPGVDPGRRRAEPLAALHRGRGRARTRGPRARAARGGYAHVGPERRGRP